MGDADLKTQHINNSSDNSLEEIRLEINEFLQTLDYESAIFWSKYIFEITESTNDLYKLIQCLTQAGQYNRALCYKNNTDLNSNHNLLTLPFRLLFATCLVKIEQYDKALDLLQLDSEYDHAIGKEKDYAAVEREKNKENTKKFPKSTNPETLLKSSDPNRILKPPNIPKSQNFTNFTTYTNFPPVTKTLSGKYILLAQIYDIQQNPNVAFECLKHALFFDNKCAAAWQRIKRKRYLTSFEEEDLSKSGILPIFTGKNLHNTFTAKLPSFLQLSKAEKLFNKHNIQDSYKITKNLISENTFDWDVLPLHLAILVEYPDESKTTELFKLSHTLMDACPNRSISWYSSGCYYYKIQNMKQARKHFARATEFQNDEHICWASWIAYGHSFARDFEHDQALAAYLQAGQLMPNIYTPNLYIGMQHLSNNNFKLAEYYFEVALASSKTNSENSGCEPFVLSEIAYTKYLQDDFVQAELFSSKALLSLESCYSAGSKWGGVLVNHGHILRKLGKYEEAEKCFEKALILDPVDCENIYVCLAMVKMFLKKFEGAIDYLQKALVIDSKNPQAVSLLQDAMELWSYR